MRGDWKDRRIAQERQREIGRQMEMTRMTEYGQCPRRWTFKINIRVRWRGFETLTQIYEPS